MTTVTIHILDCTQLVSYSLRVAPPQLKSIYLHVDIGRIRLEADTIVTVIND